MIRKFKICVDCGKPVKLDADNLYTCQLCRQRFSKTFLRAYWQGWADAKRESKKGSK